MSATLATLCVHVNTTTRKLAELVRNHAHEYDIAIAGDDKLPLAHAIPISNSTSSGAKEYCEFDIKKNEMMATVLARADFNKKIVIVDGKEPVVEIAPLVSREKLPRFFGLHPNSIWVSNDFDVSMSDDTLVG